MFTERQNQIINHFQAIYQVFGGNAEQHAILGWRDEARLGFIAPQELDELLEQGCKLFSRVAPKEVNMWTSPAYFINRSITEWESTAADNLALEYALEYYHLCVKSSPQRAARMFEVIQRLEQGGGE